VLDVGSGTGALTFAAAAIPSVRVTAVDPSDAYARYGQGRADGDRVRFEVGDARSLRFPDHTFDRTLSLLVLNFVPDPSAALREIIRVARSNDAVAAAVWDYGDGMQMLRMFWEEVGRPDHRGPDERRMPPSGRGELAALWRAHGLRERLLGRGPE
jgi:ubiquinone/menaquinone biosynthesis C-methylase UbiE